MKPNEDYVLSKAWIVQLRAIKRVYPSHTLRARCLHNLVTRLHPQALPFLHSTLYCNNNISHIIYSWSVAAAGQYRSISVSNSDNQSVHKPSISITSLRELPSEVLGRANLLHVKRHGDTSNQSNLFIDHWHGATHESANQWNSRKPSFKISLCRIRIAYIIYNRHDAKLVLAPIASTDQSRAVYSATWQGKRRVNAAPVYQIVTAGNRAMPQLFVSV